MWAESVRGLNISERFKFPSRVIRFSSALMIINDEKIHSFYNISLILNLFVFS